jgi:hypothetical protein
MRNSIEILMGELRRQELIGDVCIWGEEGRDYAVQYYTGELVLDGYDCIGDSVLSCELGCLAQCDDPEHRFIAPIIKKLSKPVIVTASELFQSLFLYFRMHELDCPAPDYREAYEHYLAYVECVLLRERNLSTFQLCRITDLRPSEQLDRSGYFQAGYAMGEAAVTGGQPELPRELQAQAEDHPPEPEWKSGRAILTYNDLRLMCGRLHVETKRHTVQAPREADTTSGIIEACFAGHVSDDVASDLNNELIGMVRSILYSYDLSVNGVGLGTSSLPCISTLTLGTTARFFQYCFSALFAKAGKRDTFEKRIANAIRLLTLSDTQVHSAIGIALSVGAIEALLGMKGENISAKLADYIAVLIEPDMALRGQAEKYVKKLYDVRSAVLHGRNLDGEAGTRSEARLLASGVLYAVWYIFDYMRRMKVPPINPDELMRQLRDGRWDGGLHEFGIDLPEVRSLWSE